MSSLDQNSGIRVTRRLDIVDGGNCAVVCFRVKVVTFAVGCSIELTECSTFEAGAGRKAGITIMIVAFF